MIHQFQSKAGPNLIMLDDLVERIFSILQRPFEARGIVLVEQMPGYIEALEKAIIQDEENQKINSNYGHQKKERLGQRIFPFLELLKKSLKANEPVLWGLQ
ncbi:MAG: DUF1840 domain-containing protein [Polynucleobacter sp.]|jgi:hypothetical protein|nr:DUF1840 domain-containing protein [Polynucleobacter sp.]